MIICKLAVLLAERKMNRRKLSLKTGLPYNIIKSYYDDTWTGIYRNTINKLCKALDVTPCELFIYKPD